jgi:hypothetical protein
MKTITDAEFASYLLRAKQKIDTHNAIVEPLSQVVVADAAAGKATKRGRKTEAVKESNKVPRLEEKRANEKATEEEDSENEGRITIPVVRGGRVLRRRAGGLSAGITSTVPELGLAGSVASGGESSKQESPPSWNEDFDPVTFVAENLKGNSSRLESLSLEELRKLAVGSGLK